MCSVIRYEWHQRTKHAMWNKSHPCVTECRLGCHRDSVQCVLHPHREELCKQSGAIEVHSCMKNSTPVERKNVTQIQLPTSAIYRQTGRLCSEKYSRLVGSVNNLLDRNRYCQRAIGTTVLCTYTHTCTCIHAWMHSE